MQARSQSYNRTAIWLHWIIAALIVFLLFPGEEYMRVARGASLSGWQPTAHTSLGILVLLLSLTRLGWRVANPPPPLPARMSQIERMASHASHWAFYALMIGLPLTGWLALAPYGAARLDADAVSFFKLFSLSILPNLGDWTREAHEISGTVAQLLLALHVLAALKHQFWDKDRIFARMGIGHG
jgi:cytochrome b561